MAKRHYIPITADVPGVNEGQRAFIRKVIRTALAAEGVDFPCEVDVLLTNDEAIHQINLDMREVDRATDVLSFPEFDLQPGELPDGEDADPGTGLVPLGDMVISMEHVAAQAKEYGHSNRRELAYLVVHSVLHLLGYDHLDEGPQKKADAGKRGSYIGRTGDHPGGLIWENLRYIRLGSLCLPVCRRYCWQGCSAAVGEMSHHFCWGCWRWEPFWREPSV